MSLILYKNVHLPARELTYIIFRALFVLIYEVTNNQLEKEEEKSVALTI